MGLRRAGRAPPAPGNPSPRTDGFSVLACTSFYNPRIFCVFRTASSDQHLRIGEPLTLRELLSGRGSLSAAGGLGGELAASRALRLSDTDNPFD